MWLFGFVCWWNAKVYCDPIEISAKNPIDFSGSRAWPELVTLVQGELTGSNSMEFRKKSWTEHPDRSVLLCTSLTGEVVHADCLHQEAFIEENSYMLLKKEQASTQLEFQSCLSHSPWSGFQRQSSSPSQNVYVAIFRAVAWATRFCHGFVLFFAV